MSGKVGVGILGLSNRGIYFADRYISKHPACQIAGFCDLNQDKLRAAKKRFRDVPCSTSIDEFLDFPGMDAVIIATPDKVHAENAFQVLKKGKHIFLEKPMAQSIEDCDALIRNAMEVGKVFMVGLELRYCTLFQDMKTMIDNHEIGKIVMANVVDNVSVGGDFYFHGVKRKKAYIKSLTLEKGTHSLDIINWMIGSSPVKVYSSAGLDVFGGVEAVDKRCRNCDLKAECPYFLDYERGKNMDYGDFRLRDDLCVYADDVDVDDNAIVLIDYANGARVSYMDCMFTPEYSREFTFIGTKGKMIGFYNNEQDFKIEVQKRHEPDKKVYSPAKVQGGHGGGDVGIMNQFITYVQENAAVLPGVLGARDSAAIAIAAAESAAHGRPVHIQGLHIPNQ